MQSGSMESDASVPTLPDDVLADILGRLLAGSLATSRRVCKAWRDIVDERGLLQRIRRLLPHSVSGIFVNFLDYRRPHFLARPTSSSSSTVGPYPAIDGKFSYVLPEWRREAGDYKYKVADHCNGLVLYQYEEKKNSGGELYVCNPTTQRWVCLPKLAGRSLGRCRAFLAFSPAVSQHYLVLVAPLELSPEEENWEDEEEQWHDHPLQDAPPAGDTEWPPSRWTWNVFSSRSGQWRERVFERQGEAAGIVADPPIAYFDFTASGTVFHPWWRYAVHRQGALYVHCPGEFVSRLSLSAGESYYHVIKSPIDRPEWCKKDVQSYLGGSQGEVYFVAINRGRLAVWMLNDHESQQHDPTAGSEWILKHDRVLWPNDWARVAIHGACWHQNIQREDCPWLLDDCCKYRKDWRKLDWSSDSDSDDNVICRHADEEEELPYPYPKTFVFVGFHPYKEVIFLETLNVVVAYHLSTSKVQFLGILQPTGLNYDLYDSFVYTPCHDLRHRG